MVAFRMKKKFTPTFIIDRGRVRIAIWLRWNPRNFKWGIASRGPGSLVGGFGFGMFTYMLRHYIPTRA